MQSPAPTTSKQATDYEGLLIREACVKHENKTENNKPHI